MVVTGSSPYPTGDRARLSVSAGGGKGVLISPRWVLTASHCITASKAKSGSLIQFGGDNGRTVKVGVDKVLRHPTKDLALLRLKRLVKKAEREPVLLLRQSLVKKDGQVKIKKVLGIWVF